MFAGGATDPGFSLSVIMPVFNGARYVAEALRSIDAQVAGSGATVELIVVDDGSTDGSLDIIRGFPASFPVRIFESGGSGNWVAATNLGLAQASGRFSCLLHQDDRWEPGRLGLIREAFSKSPGLKWITTESWFIDESGDFRGLWHSPFSKLNPQKQSGRCFEALLVQNSLAICAPVFDTGLVRSLGGLNEQNKYTADWELWLRLAARGAWAHVTAPTVSFRVHPFSQTVALAGRPDEFRRNLNASMESGIQLGRQHQIHLPQSTIRAARFSVSINAFLAGVGAGGLSGAMRSLISVMVHAVALGPTGLFHYFQWSRITDRVFARRALLRWDFGVVQRIGRKTRGKNLD